MSWTIKKKYIGIVAATQDFQALHSTQLALAVKAMNNTMNEEVLLPFLHSVSLFNVNKTKSEGHISS